MRILPPLGLRITSLSFPSIPPGADVDLTQFADAEEIDADAEDAVRWAYASDLLTEKDGKLRVQEELSRKELSRMLEDLLALSSAD